MPIKMKNVDSTAWDTMVFRSTDDAESWIRNKVKEI